MSKREVTFRSGLGGLLQLARDVQRQRSPAKFVFEDKRLRSLFSRMYASLRSPLRFQTVFVSSAPAGTARPPGMRQPGRVNGERLDASAEYGHAMRKVLPMCRKRLAATRGEKNHP